MAEPAQKYRHRKTGGVYRLIARGCMESDLAPVTIYAAADGTVWVRPTAEFNDGRFVPIEDTSP